MIQTDSPFHRLDVHRFRPSPDWDFSKPHCHDWHELVYVEQGRYRVLVDGEVVPVRPATVIAYPAGCVHHPQPATDRSTTLYMIQWQGGDGLLSPTRVQTASDRDSRLIDLLAWLWHRSLRRRWTEDAMQPSLAMTVLAWLDDASNDPPPRTAVSLKSEIQRGCRYMEDTMASNITLGDVAHFVQKSESQTIRLFVRHLGTTPMRYLRDLRVRKAIRLLRSTRMTLDEVVSRTGLGSAAYASRLIKTATGKSPRALRER